MVDAKYQKVLNKYVKKLQSYNLELNAEKNPPKNLKPQK